MKMRIRGERILMAAAREPWAITHEKFSEIASFLALTVNGGEVSDEEIRAIMAARPNRSMGRRGGVAVIPLTGTILQRASAMEETSGIVSIERWKRAFMALVNDPAISTIVIQIDSPGGSVGGTPELAQLIYEAREQKQIIAVADSLMASAAYYIGAAATEVVAVPSALVGSIGVYTLHADFSAYHEKLGVKVSIIKFGENKAEANPFEPLSDSAREHMQETVDAFGNMFVRDVARFRAVKPSVVREQFGSGRVFNAPQAKALGMIDRIATFEEVLAKLGVSSQELVSARAEDDALQPVADSALSAADVAHDEAITISKASANIVPPAEPPPDDEQDDTSVAKDGGAPTGETVPPDTIAADAAEGSMSVQNGATQPQAVATVSVGADPAMEERKRITDIQAIATQHNAPARFVQAAIEQGMSADAFKRFIEVTDARANGPVHAGPIVDMTAEEQRRYSVARAIQAAADGDWSNAGLEREVQDALRAKIGHRSRGGTGNSVLIPTGLGPLPRNFRGVEEEIARPRAALTTGGSSSGAELVFTEPGSFIDMLRSRMVTTAMGATFLQGLQGNVSFPKQTGAGTFSWRAENPGSDVSLSDLVTGQVQLSPNDGTSATSYSRRLLAQSAINVEQLVRRDLAAIAARGIDRAALHGAGGNEPTGIYSASGVNSVAFDGEISFEKIVDMETAIAADDADIAAMGYVTTPEIRGRAKVTQLFSGTNGAPLWTGGVVNGEMNGYRAMASTQISKTLGTGSDEHGIIFGAWEHLLIGEWGAMELIVDPYTLGRQGLIVVTIYLIADVAIRYPEAFAKGTGLVPQAAS